MRRDRHAGDAARDRDALVEHMVESLRRAARVLAGAPGLAAVA